MAATNAKYGLGWDASLSPAQIEREMLRQGGYVIHNGKKYGLGLFQHFKNYWSALWPDDSQTRWTDLLLKTILENKYVGVVGPASSWKTGTCARIGLMDWSLFPDCTTVLVSSTTMDDLRARVYGEILMMYRIAKERHEWFPGNPIDHRCVIAHDNIDEVKARDTRNGIIGIPNKTADGKVQGMSKFAGRKNTRVWAICDETQFCFPAGTLIDTPSGKIPIESLKAGDRVFNASGVGRIKATMNRMAEKLVEIKTIEGVKIVCTPNHPFFTQHGWVKACELNQEHVMLTTYESMRILREGIQKQEFSGTLLRSGVCKDLECKASEKDEGLSDLWDKIPSSGAHAGVQEVPKQEKEVQAVLKLLPTETSIKRRSFLQSVLLLEVDDERPGIQEKVLHQGARGKNENRNEEVARREPGTFKTNCEPDEITESISRVGPDKKGVSITEADRLEAASSRREWNRPNQGRVNADENVSIYFETQLSSENWNEERKRIPDLFQVGCSNTGFEAWNRSGREFTSFIPPENSRCKEDEVFEGSRVDSVTLLEQENFRKLGRSEGGIAVYNISVEGHPSYSVNGFLVHNCERSFLDAQNNLSRNGPSLVPGFVRDANGVIMRDSLKRPIPLNGYKAVFIGNPNPTRPENCLHTVCEPEGGWSSVPEDGKTKTWIGKQVPNSVVKAAVVALDSMDSPNTDFPGDKLRFPKLCSRQGLAEYQPESEAYWTQGRGVVKLGLAGLKIITKEICEQFHAFDSLVWDGPDITRIGMLDAAYGGVGGDRCVTGYLEFGKCVDGVIRILVHPPILVPVKIMPEMIPEDQIAMFCKDKMEGFGVPPENFFFDGRGAMGISLARIWSPKVNSVEFGGRPTDRPVGPDIFTVDKETGIRRLKTAQEHYSKFVTELWYSSLYAIQSDQVRGLTIDVVMDAQPREWKRVAGDKIEAESKKDMKKRTGISPDLADWFVIGVEGARRRGFQIAKLGKESPKKKVQKSWLDSEAEEYESAVRSKELEFNES